ncbi:MAG: CotH kinase family protein [Clostridia bacterium]|nr:CotH kinase family protein [Clostridia bacterium]
MKKYALIFLLLCTALLCLHGCVGTAEETILPEETTVRPAPADPSVKRVSFISGTTFSGPIRPVVIRNAGQLLDTAPVDSAAAGKRIYTVNNENAGKIIGIREQTVGKKVRFVEVSVNPGYKFVSWSDGLTDLSRSDEDAGLYTAIFDYDIQSMPILVIETENGGPIESKENYVPASLSLYGCKEKYVLEDAAAEIRGRGNNSWTYPKKSYKFKLAEKENLLGLASGRERTWCLLANQCDMSLQRNRVAFEFCRFMDGFDWSPACTPVEVYLNGEYAGVYLLTEEIRVSGDRVDIADENPDAVDTGYLVEMSNYAEGDAVIQVNGRSYMIHSDLSADRQIRKQQMAYIREYLAEAFDALVSGSREKAEALIDLDSLLAAYLVEETIENLDSQWDSFYLHKDAGGRLVFGPIWDFDLSMGNADEGSENPEGLYVGNGRGSGNSYDSWFGAALMQPWFREMAAEKWIQVYDSFVQMPLFIRDEAEIGMASYERNFQKWKIFGQKQNRETESILALHSYEEHYTWLAEWLERRIAWLDGLFRDPDFVTLGRGLTDYEYRLSLFQPQE